MSSQTPRARLDVQRETSESSIDLVASTSTAPGTSDIETSVPFFDHLLTAFAKHSLTDLTVRANGDIDIDVHHTVEDTGIVLGQAIRQALGDKRGISRFGDALVPLDEALAQAVVDISGRPYLVHTGEPAGFEYHLIGGHFTGSMVRHVFEAITFNAGLTVHVTVLGGRDPHHIAEAEFKAFARAFRQAEGARPARRGHPVDEGRPVSRHAVASSCSTTVRATCTRPPRRSKPPAPRSSSPPIAPRRSRPTASSCRASARSPRSWTQLRRGARRRDHRPSTRRRPPGARHLRRHAGAVRARRRARRRHRGARRVAGRRHRARRPRCCRTWAGTRSTPDEGSVLFDGIEDERFYFVHSFAAQQWHARRDAAVPEAEAHVGRARRAVPRRRRERPAVGDPVPPREVRRRPASGCSRTGSARSTERADVRAGHADAPSSVKA